MVAKNENTKLKLLGGEDTGTVVEGLLCVRFNLTQ